MTDSAIPLPMLLLATFDSVVLQMLDTVDIGSSRDGDSIIDKAQKQLVQRIAELSLRRGQRRNSQQAVFKLPPELLIRSMSFLSTKNLLSVIRACHQLRTIVCETSSLWTHVDRIDDPSAFLFVLEHAKGLPVSIADLRVNGADDDRLRVVASHMSQVRALSLHIDDSLGGVHGLSTSTHAYTLFTTPAPVLQQLSISGVEGARYVVMPHFGLRTSSTGHSLALFAGITPLLNSLHLHTGHLTDPFLRILPNKPSVRTFSFGMEDGMILNEHPIMSCLSMNFPDMVTMNLELARWGPGESTGGFPRSLRRINIRWTDTTSLSPSDIILQNGDWNIVHIIHVTNICETPWTSPNVGSTSSAVIPATNSPYHSFYTRFSATSGPRVHARAVDAKTRERIFCGLQPATVAGIVSRIPSEELLTIIASTATVAFNIFSNARCPALRRIHLISDTRDASWVDVFARDVLNLTTLERIEFSVEANAKAYNWTTKTILRVLASCMAAGSVLNEVVFLGFEPEARCVSRAATFADRVIVDRHWKEPPADRIWFMQPSFEWM